MLCFVLLLRGPLSVRLKGRHRRGSAPMFIFPCARARESANPLTRKTLPPTPKGSALEVAVLRRPRGGYHLLPWWSYLFLLSLSTELTGCLSHMASCSRGRQGKTSGSSCNFMHAAFRFSNSYGATGLQESAALQFRNTYMKVRRRRAILRKG